MRRPTRRPIHLLGLVGVVAVLAGCATLSQIVQPPVFELAGDRGSSVRLLGPSLQRPLGGAQLEVWARVENPNPVGFTLSRLTGTVLLGDRPAAEVDLPLGLPLEPSEQTVIPLRLTVGFSELPELAEALREAVSRGTIEYALRGTVAVDAGAFGKPSFGPRTWIQAEIPIRR